MGQSLKKLSAGHEEKKIKEIRSIIDNNYMKLDPKKCTLADFYRAVSDTVEEINKAFGNTQFRVPSVEKLKASYHHAHPEHPEHLEETVSREQFQKILQDLLITEARFTGVGAKDTLIYIFGVPLTAFLIKQGLFPRAIRNEFFIPGITSATVFALANLNKI